MENNKPEQKPETPPTSELQKIMNRGCLGITITTLLTIVIIIIEVIRTS